MRCKQTTHFFFIPKVVHFVLKSCTFRFKKLYISFWGLYKYPSGAYVFSSGRPTGLPECHLQQQK